MILDNKKLFLAGATGMAGASILKYITENYAKTDIRASIHLTEPFIKHRRIEYINGDLKSVDDVRRMCRGCDCAIMAAAYAGGAGFTRSYPWEHMKENLLMNLQMLEAFRLENIKRVIFIGSAAIYQEFEGSIKEEDLDFNKEPHEAYYGFSWGMRFLEKLCKFLNKRFGMEVIIVRLANIFGPYARFDPKVSNFIPAIIRKAIDKIEPFEVWGSPDVTRDVLYVDDFARAIIMMLENEHIKFEIFNLGSGIRTTVADVVAWALKYVGHRPKEIRYSQDKPGTIKFRALDCSKVKKMLDWQPRYSIEEGIKKTTEWWMENRDTWKK